MAAIPHLPSAPAGLATDSRSLDVLRSRAALDPKGAVKAAAKQFEALFMNELMKSMRSSTLASGMLDSEGGKLGTEMLDKQYADQMTGLPGGLSDIIARQLERQMGLPPALPPAKGAAISVEAGTPGQAIDRTLRTQRSTP